MPAGWEVSPDEDTSEDEDELDQAFADCLDIDVAEVSGDNPSAESNFANADDQEVGSSVEVAESADDVHDHLERFRSSDGQQCYREVISEFIAKSFIEQGEDDLELGDMTFNELAF